MSTNKRRLLSTRCIFEAPILDERKWAKVPSIPADGFILDMEDSATDQDKGRAEERVVEYLSRPEYFNGALLLPRPNAIGSEWGEQNLRALAAAKPGLLMLSKVNDVEEVIASQRILESQGATPDLLICIESARGVRNVNEILALDRVVGMAFGPGDLQVDLGVPLYEGDAAQISRVLVHAKLTAVLAARAAGLAAFCIAYAPNLKDLADVNTRILAEKSLGFTGLTAFYPPHVELINAAFGVSETELEAARETVRIYEAASSRGDAAVLLPDGSALLVHQYKTAQAIVSRFGVDVGS